MNNIVTMARILSGIAAAACAAAALGAGGGTLNDPQEIYSSAWKEPPSDAVTASITVQFVAFELNAVAGKYKLIPILLRAGARAGPLSLSLDQDRLIVVSGGQRVAASFQLSVLDRALWDSLPSTTKERLTYPEQMSPNSAVMVYAFVPLADLKGTLEGFEYTIKSLPAPLQLVAEQKKKAATLSFELRG